MCRARVLESLFPTIVLIVASGLRTLTAEAATRPHILFVLADDQRFDTIAALGNRQIQTPNLDRLVERGFHFTNAYCMGSMIPAVCQPSRTMILTGRSLWRIPDNPRAKTAPPGVAVLPAVVAAAGYRTFHCGKAGNSCTFAHAAFNTNIESTERTANSASENADHAIAYVRGYQGAQPIFMYLAPSVPHDPRLSPPRFGRMYDPEAIMLSRNFMPRHPFDNGELAVRDELLAPHPRTPQDMRRHLADYYATISHLDFELGRVLAAFADRGWLENTVVIFSSDQGLAVGGRHGLMGKQNLYEHFKSPLVIAGPAIPSGKSDALVYLFDLFPTICDLAGAHTPAQAEGTSLLPIVRGQQTPTRQWLFCAYRYCQRMVRDARWKLICYNANGIRNKQLFDLAADPDELVNLADDPPRADQRARLEGMLLKARHEFGDPVDF